MNKKAEKKGLAEILKILFRSLPCCEMAICLIISLVLSIALCLLISQEGWETAKNALGSIWESIASVSASLAGLIMAVLAILYTLGGKVLNDKEFSEVFTELTSIMTLGIFLHLTTMILALIMFVFDESMGLGITTLFFFIFSIASTFNILVHLFSIHSALN